MEAPLIRFLSLFLALALCLSVSLSDSFLRVSPSAQLPYHLYAADSQMGISANCSSAPVLFPGGPFHLDFLLAAQIGHISKTLNSGLNSSSSLPNLSWTQQFLFLSPPSRLPGSELRTRFSCFCALPLQGVRRCCAPGFLPHLAAAPLTNSCLGDPLNLLGFSSLQCTLHFVTDLIKILPWLRGGKRTYPLLQNKGSCCSGSSLVMGSFSSQLARFAIP